MKHPDTHVAATTRATTALLLGVGSRGGANRGIVAATGYKKVRLSARVTNLRTGEWLLTVVRGVVDGIAGVVVAELGQAGGDGPGHDAEAGVFALAGEIVHVAAGLGGALAPAGRGAGGHGAGGVGLARGGLRGRVDGDAGARARSPHGDAEALAGRGVGGIVAAGRGVGRDRGGGGILTLLENGALGDVGRAVGGLGTAGGPYNLSDGAGARSVIGISS